MTAPADLPRAAGAPEAGPVAGPVAGPDSAGPIAIDRADVVAEVTAAFERYEDALVHNRVAILDELFWRDPRTLRYGATENLYGHDAIASFRATRPGTGLMRDLLDVRITTYGRDFATANCEFRRHGSDRIGRQSQTWLRTPAGWRVVAAHVSLLEPGAAAPPLAVAAAASAADAAPGSPGAPFPPSASAPSASAPSASPSPSSFPESPRS